MNDNSENYIYIETHIRKNKNGKVFGVRAYYRRKKIYDPASTKLIRKTLIVKK